MSRAAATRLVPEDVPLRWVHADGDTPSVSRDVSIDFLQVQVGAPNSEVTSGGGYAERVLRNMPVGADGAGSMAPVVVNVDMPVAVTSRSSGVVASSGGDAVVVRRFLEDTCILSLSEASMSLSKMHAYGRRRVGR